MSVSAEGWNSDGSDGGGLDPFPVEFDTLRIGTAINADLNQLIPGTVAFKMGCLAEKDLLTIGFGRSSSQTWGSGTTQQSQEVSGWSASAGMGLKTGIIDASAKFYIQQTMNACKQSSNVSIVGATTYKNSIELRSGTRQEYIACATETFKSAINKVYEAATALESVDPEANPALVATLLDALTQFYERFGTGYVDRIELEATGVFEGTLISDSDFTESNLDVGGEFSLSLPGFGAGAAADYCRQQTNASRAVEFATRSYGRPAACPPADWARTFQQTFTTDGIAKCTDTEVWKLPMSNPPAAPRDPVIDPLPVPEVADLPDLIPGIGKIIAGAIQTMQFRNLDAAYKTDGDTDDKEAALGSELAALRDQAKRTEELATQPLAENVESSHFSATADAPTPGLSARSEPGSVTTHDVFGDYAPSGYRYQPWSHIFEELNFAKGCTRDQVVFGQSLVWFSIRGVFAQYLDYCARYPDVVGRDMHVKGAANRFRGALAKVGRDLLDALHRKTADLNFLQQLEANLKTYLGPGFGMYDHYRFWINNYAWLKKVPFGVVAVVERNGQHFIQENQYPHPTYLTPTRGKGFTPTKSIDPDTLLDANAYRLYPIISTNAQGEPYFVWVGAPSRLKGTNEDAVQRFSGLLSFSPNPQAHPSAQLPEEVRKQQVNFDETTVPMLIHQSEEAANVIARAEDEFRWPADIFHQGVSGEQRLRERWNNRKAMFGMQLYPGFGDEDGFGAEFLLSKAAQLAKDASRYNDVLPAVEDITGDVWRLRDAATKGPWAAYFAKHDAMFFWGPGATGWDLPLEKCEILLVPIGYETVTNAGGVKSGGRPMWMEPRTENLIDQLNDLAKE